MPVKRLEPTHEGYSPKAKSVPTSDLSRKPALTLGGGSHCTDVIEDECEVRGSKPAFELLGRASICRLITSVQTQSIGATEHHFTKDGELKVHFVSSESDISEFSLLPPESQIAVPEDQSKVLVTLRGQIALPLRTKSDLEPNSSSRASRSRERMLEKNFDDYKTPDPQNPFVIKRQIAMSKVATLHTATLRR